MPHDLRHTAASLAMPEGANVKAIQRMVGHASAAMTLDVYADQFEDDLDQVRTAWTGLRLGLVRTQCGLIKPVRLPTQSGRAVLTVIEQGKCGARPAGFEPATDGLEVRCSIR
jgi:hypothetical protein